MRPGMRTVLAALLLAGLAGNVRAATDRQGFNEIERGRYLVRLGDCTACHTASGGQPFAGGRPIETPFGAILASNITPDRDAGIGRMSDQQFVDALQKGRGRNGRHLYPAMPYTYLTRVTRDDALAMRAYLATVKPVSAPVHENQLPFPFNVRLVMAGWNLLFFKDEQFRPDPRQSAEWNRGAYLVTGLEHCGMCHTPKNLLGADHTGRALQGNALQGWFAPNITNDARRGLGNWSVDDIAAYLRTGHNGFAAASGPMAEEVSHSSDGLADSDLRAMAVYLKTRPGQDETAHPLDAARPDMRAGAAIYADLCSSCHTPNGAGVPMLFPRLAGSPAVQSTDPASIIRVILRGGDSVATTGAPTGPQMPSFAWDLNDAQIAAVSTFVRNAWGNAASAVSSDRVGRDRQRLSRQAAE